MFTRRQELRAITPLGRGGPLTYWHDRDAATFQSKQIQTRSEGSRMAEAHHLDVFWVDSHGQVWSQWWHDAAGLS
jgi:hypothetical protein